MKVNIVVPWNLPKLKGRKKGALHRMAFYLARMDGWQIKNEPGAGVNYVFEYAGAWKVDADPWRKYRERGAPLACYFTHREPVGIKHRLWHDAAETVDLRVAQSLRMATALEKYGPTVHAAIPIERDLFCLKPSQKRTRPLIGVSGYCPISGRKGNSLVYALTRHPVTKSWNIVAAGRNWPVPTKMYRWHELPSFYQSLSLYLCPSLYEGGPLGVFEVLGCGVPVVIPIGVGALDELPSTHGIYRYTVGDFDAMVAALQHCIDDLGTHDRKALRATTENMTIEAFCEDHRRAFAKYFGRVA